MSEPQSVALPDVLQAGLRVVFCGTAAGRHSAQRRVYYANPRNRFWRTIAGIGLTPRILKPHEFRSLSLYGIGVTDIAKLASGMDRSLRTADFDVPGFRTRIEKAAPTCVGFNGKRSARLVLDLREVEYGLQPAGLWGMKTKVFVLPSTSGSASKYWDERHWKELAALLQGNARGSGDSSAENA